MATREQKSALTRIQRIIQNAQEAEALLLAAMEEPEVDEEEEDEVHAEYDRDEKGFVCLVGRKKICKESVYTAGEMVAHLEDEHDIDPDDAIIDGWTARHDKQLAKFLESKAEAEEDEAYTKAELNDMNKAEIKEILDEWDEDYPSKANKTSLVKLVLASQSKEDEDDEEEEEEAGDGYVRSELEGMKKAGLREILDEWEVPYRKKDNMATLIDLILNAQSAEEAEEEEEDEEEEEEDFTPYKLKSKEAKNFQKKHDLESDEMKLIVDYANEEEVTLQEAADEFELAEPDEDVE